MPPTKILLLLPFVSLGNQVRNTDVLIRFGKRLKQLREGKNMSQHQLALHCGIEHSQISRIELGKINTTVSTIFLIADNLGIDAADLMNIK